MRTKTSLEVKLCDEDDEEDEVGLRDEYRPAIGNHRKWEDRFIYIQI